VRVGITVGTVWIRMRIMSNNTMSTDHHMRDDSCTAGSRRLERSHSLTSSMVSCITRYVHVRPSVVGRIRMRRWRWTIAVGCQRRQRWSRTIVAVARKGGTNSSPCTPTTTTTRSIVVATIAVVVRLLLRFRLRLLREFRVVTSSRVMIGPSRRGGGRRSIVVLDARRQRSLVTMMVTVGIGHAPKDFYARAIRSRWLQGVCFGVGQAYRL
jgi:hypothetical protein